MGTFSVWHWIIVLLVVLLIFGSGKLRNAGRDLGGTIHDFRKSVEPEDDERPSILSGKDKDPTIVNHTKKNC